MFTSFAFNTVYHVEVNFSFTDCKALSHRSTVSTQVDWPVRDFIIRTTIWVCCLVICVLSAPGHLVKSLPEMATVIVFCYRHLTSKIN